MTKDFIDDQTQKWAEYAWIGLGTNIGDMAQSLDFAQTEIQKLSETPIIQSSLYQSEPWGLKDQPIFINQVIGIMPKYTPEYTLETLLSIEKICQRHRILRWGPRTLDLDLLAWKSQSIQTEFLTLPHPRLHLRKFVLIPWLEISGNIFISGLNQTVADLAQNCTDPSWVKKCDIP